MCIRDSYSFVDDPKKDFLLSLDKKKVILQRKTYDELVKKEASNNFAITATVENKSNDSNLKGYTDRLKLSIDHGVFIENIHQQSQLDSTELSSNPDDRFYSNAEIIRISGDKSYKPEEVTFEVTEINGNSPNAQVLKCRDIDDKGNVSIQGVRNKQNETLIAVLDKVHAFDTVRYQWHRNGEVINKETKPSYTQTEKDVDKEISVSVTYRDLQSHKIVNISNKTICKEKIDGKVTVQRTISKYPSEVTNTNISFAVNNENTHSYFYEYGIQNLLLEGANVGDKITLKLKFTRGINGNNKEEKELQATIVNTIVPKWIESEPPSDIGSYGASFASIIYGDGIIRATWDGEEIESENFSYTYKFKIIDGFVYLSLIHI